MNNNQTQISSIPIRNLSVRIDLLDKRENVVDQLEGIIIDGSISVDGDSEIRRTCNMTANLVSKNLLPINSQSRIWLDKKFRLHIGIDNIVNSEGIVWFEQGIFYFDNPQVSIDDSSSTVSFTGLDKMCLLDGSYGGTLGYTTKINADTPIFEAVKNLVTLGGENRYIINDVEDLVIPYDLEKDSSSTILDFLIEIRDLYMGFEFFYDVNGYFVFQKIRDRKYDMVEWEFLNDDKLVIKFDNVPDWTNVKNKVIVWGREFDDKDQITATLENVSDNQFGSSYIGEKLLVVDEDTIQTLQQAQLRCEYELYLHGNLNETISFDCIAIYGLDVNKMIKVENSASGINGNYLIKKLSFDIGSGVMNVGAVKMYY